MKILFMFALCLGAVPTLAAPKGAVPANKAPTQDLNGVQIAPHSIDARAIALLDKAAKSYKALDSIEMSVVSSSPDVAPKIDDVQKIEVAFRRPNFMRARTIRSQYELWTIANDRRMVIFGGQKATIIPIPLRPESAIGLFDINSGVGEASGFEQKWLATLLEGRNPLRSPQFSRSDFFVGDVRFLEARVVNGRTCEGIVWPLHLAKKVGVSGSLEWTNWFDTKTMRLCRVQTRIKLMPKGRPAFTSTMIQEIETTDNPKFAPDFFEWQAPPNVEVTTLKPPYLPATN